MDQGGSEEGKRPDDGPAIRPGDSAAPEDASISEKARELLESYGGKLDEVVHLLERTAADRAGSPADGTSSPVAQPLYRPPSMHFDPRPVSTRTGTKVTLPPPHSPPPSHTWLRLLIETAFLIVIAYTSIRLGLRMRSLVGSEGAAFAVVVLIELSRAHERRVALRKHLEEAEQVAIASVADRSSAATTPASPLGSVEPLVWTIGELAPANAGLEESPPDSGVGRTIVSECTVEMSAEALLRAAAEVPLEPKVDIQPESEHEPSAQPEPVPEPEPVREPQPEPESLAPPEPEAALAAEAEGIP